MPMPQAIMKNRGLMLRVLVLASTSVIAWCMSILVVCLGRGFGFSRGLILGAWVALAGISAVAALLIPDVAGSKRAWRFHLSSLGFMLVALLLTKLLMSALN